MVLGALWVPDASLQTVEDAVYELRRKHNCWGELKWGKVSANKMTFYRDVVDRLFFLLHRDHVNYHSLIVDMSRLDHKRYSAGDHEIGFYKFYYFLLLKCGKLYCPKRGYTDFHVRLDERPSKYDLNELKGILNRGHRRAIGHDHPPFRSVEARTSSHESLIQLTDILTGAIGFHKNEKHSRPEASAARVELMKRIARHARNVPLSSSTGPLRHRFTVWNFRMAEKK